MKITKFPQSCVLIETNEKKILVDPGTLDYEESLLEKWKQAEVILVTHKHGDHCNQEVIKELTKNPEVKFYTSKEVKNYYPELNPEVVKQGDKIDLGGIKVEVVKAIHGYIPLLKGEKEVNENIGFIIKGDKTAYITSDTLCFKNDYKCDVLIVPISNHGLVMGPYEVGLFSKETEAKLVIPTHLNNPRFQMNLEKVREILNNQEVNYKFLENGESLEIK